MATEETIELKDLIGLHSLSGVDTVNRLGGWNNTDNCQVINFVLDGETYTAVENPDDGYRSSMEMLYLSNEKVENNFAPIMVLARMAGDTDWEKNDYIQFIDVKNGKIVLEVGTKNYDDYYPYFVGSFNPVNMSTND